VNTSFNVAAPIAQSPLQALDTLRRANGGRRFQWAKEPRSGVGGRIRRWAVDWQLETSAGAEDLADAAGRT
jgi:carbamoyltransferase